MNFYVVMNDNGEFAHIDMDELTWETGFATLWFGINKPYAKRTASDYGGHVVTLIEEQKVKLPREVGEELEDWLKTDNIDDILDKIVCIYDGDHSVVRNWWASTLGATYLIADMARYGWESEKQTLYNVKVPHTKDVWYYKSWNGSLQTIGQANKELVGKFTESEIEHYDLQDCEKEEVTDDEQ